jgi:uncharacterized membrane protein (DUF2068 family)
MFFPNSSKEPGMRLIRAIAVFKLFKAVILCGLGLGVFRLLDPEAGQKLVHWVGSFAWSYNHGFLLEGLTKLTGLSHVQLKELGIGAFLYATLFIVEGAGLWSGRRWAEYLTVIATGSLLPFEVYELFRKPTIPRGTALVINLLIVIYLIIVVRRQSASRKSNSIGRD